MNRIYMLLIVSIASCNLLGAAAPAAALNERDYNEGFYEAIEKNDIGRVQIFLERGADVRSRFRCGTTPLHEAIRFRHKELVELFLERDADINGKALLSGFTPLIGAIVVGDIEVVKLLLAKGADVNAEISADGDTSLHYVAREGLKEVVTILLECGANKSAKTLSGITAAERARQNDHNDLADFIESWEPLEIKEPGDD
jgi:ankyrin repeat protein